MRIATEIEGRKATIVLEGRLDVGAAPQFEACANRLWDQGVRDVLVDMELCEYVSSAGLRSIVSLSKRATRAGSLTFVRVPPQVMEIFTYTGFDAILSFA